MNDIPKAHARVGQYVVGLIDILNQRQELARWDDIDAATQSGLEPELAKTVGVVERTRDIFRRCAEIHSQQGPLIHEVASLMTPSNAEKYLRMEAGQMNCQSFADTNVLFARTNLVDGVSSFKEVWGMICGAAICMQASLSEGVAVRGGIEFGAGCELTKGEVYGPVLASAYCLEHTVAKWPRVLIGCKLLGLLRRVAMRVPGGFDAIAIRSAHLCLDRIVQCGDGEYMVDFFHPKMSESGNSSDRTARFAAALAFVKSEWTKFKGCSHEPEPKCRCQELASRYEELHRYLKSRACYST